MKMNILRESVICEQAFVWIFAANTTVLVAIIVFIARKRVDSIVCSNARDAVNDRACA